jgi:hypothetical protein
VVRQDLGYLSREELLGLIGEKSVLRSLRFSFQFC